MVTLERASYQTQKRYAEYCGLSEDQKPIEDINNGDEFQEIDTGFTYKFNTESMQWVKQPQSGGGGSGGTTDYNQLFNKPSINGITLEGNKTTENLDIIPVVDLGEVSGGLPIQITLNAEQIQTMQKDNCIVTALYSGINLSLRKIGSSDTQLVFSGIASNSSMYLLVNVSELQGTFNIFNIAEIPSPTGPDDSGKVLIVNQEGTGWVLGDSSSVGDMELVASATLEEAVDVISLELSKPCTEVIAVLTPYGDDSNQDTNTIPFIYAGDGASADLKGITLGTMKLKSNSAMVYAFRAARFLISGNLAEKTMYEATGAAPTGITLPDSYPWNFKNRNWEITSINAIQNIRLQLWGYVWGVGTKLEVYGR